MLPIPQQAHRVEDDEYAADLMGDGAADHAEVATRCQTHHGDIVHKREPQPLLNDPQGMATQADGERDLLQIVRHQRDMRGFVRDIGAGHAHRHADVGYGQGGGVVDAVADHRDTAKLPQRFDVLGFLFR